MSEQSDLRSACQAFIELAFAVLMQEHVLPTPVYHPHIAVGRGSFGASIMSLAEFTALEALLNQGYAERFAEPLKRDHAEFAKTYIFGLLEACIARCTQARSFTASGSPVEESIHELLTVLRTQTYELVCARHVSHLTTTRAAEVQICQVIVVPEPAVPHDLLSDRVRREIPGTPRAWNRDLPHQYDPPHALLIIRETTDAPDPYDVRNRLSGGPERFLLLARLLIAGTVQPGYEVSEMTMLITLMNLQMRTSNKDTLDTLVRRTAVNPQKGSPHARWLDPVDEDLGWVSLKRVGECPLLPMTGRSGKPHSFEVRPLSGTGDALGIVST